MASVSRRSLVALAVCCGVLLASQALLVSVPLSAASGSSCTELKRWAQSYRGTSPSLDQLARFDRAHRVAIFNAVTPQVRAALWQEQLRRFDQRQDLTVPQHELIAEARGIVTPALYSHEAAAMTAYESLTPRIKQTFASSREYKLFLTNVAFTGSPQQQTATLWDRLSSPFVAHAQNGVVCDCNTSSGSTDCWSGSCGGGSCFTTGGCGIFGNLTCNGICN
jgi:hypothetical protein